MSRRGVMSRAVRFCVAALILIGAPAAAQQPSEAATSSSTEWILRNWTRLESWSFFEPPPGGGQPEYLYGANRLHAGVRRTTRHLAFTATMQFVQFGGLPQRATGPGLLGPGATYFSQAGRSDSRGVSVRYLNLELASPIPGLRIQLGRMPYASGAEIDSGDPQIEIIKRQRIDARLIGEFDWSLYQRAFDGLRGEYRHAGWTGTGFAVRPTQGGFEDTASITIDDVTVTGATLTAAPGRVIPHVESQLFFYGYQDARHVSMRPDNTGLPAAAADVNVATLGTTLVGISPPRNGTALGRIGVARVAAGRLVRPASPRGQRGGRRRPPMGDGSRPSMGTRRIPVRLR
jgi:hypothetical protein